VNLKEKLAESEWCDHLVTILQQSLEHDQREKVLESIRTLLNVCSTKLDDKLSYLVKHLGDLSKEYKELADNEADLDDNAYFKKMHELTDLLKDYFVNKKTHRVFEEDL
jgi:hypothetical protein